MKHLPLLGVLVAGLFLLGAGCETTTTTTTDTTGGSAVEDTTTTPATGGAITVTTPASGATVSSPITVDAMTTKTTTVYVRILDSKGATQVTAEVKPTAAGAVKSSQIYFFGGKGAAGKVEFFHKDGTTETDLVSIPVNLK